MNGLSILARLKGFAIGVSPLWGTRTVVVSDVSGQVVRLGERKGRRNAVSGKRQRQARARIFL